MTIRRLWPAECYNLFRTLRNPPKHLNGGLPPNHLNAFAVVFQPFAGDAVFEIGESVTPVEDEEGPVIERKAAEVPRQFAWNLILKRFFPSCVIAVEKDLLWQFFHIL